ncbi:MAG: hypothetical protein V1708_00070 [Candidatus Micrarchaeota archaeon]
MSSLTLSVPDAVLARMRQFPGVKWSQVVRAVIVAQMDDWEKAEKIASKSALTQKDVDQLASAVDKHMAGHFKAA